MLRCLFAGLLGLVTLQAGSAGEGKSALDKATLEAYIRHLFMWGPQIKVTISDPKPSELPGLLEVKVRAEAGGAVKDEPLLISKDGQKILRAVILPVDKNPFHKELEKLTTTSQPGLGTPGAPVVIVVFSDFQCQFCAQEGQMLRQNLIVSYPDKVRLYFKDLPLEQIHPWAKAAAIAGRCIYQQSSDAFWSYHDWIFSQQSQITKENLKAKVLEHAKTAGKLDEFKLGNCIDTAATEPEVRRSIEEARDLQVNATPTLFINGRRISAQIPWENLKQLIDFELEYQKTAQNAGEACCSVKLPSPLN